MANATSVHGFGMNNLYSKTSKTFGTLYCLKPIQRVINAETFEFRKLTFLVGGGRTSDLVVGNADICERQAEFKKSSQGWSVRDVSDYRYNVLINWEAIEKNTYITIEEGDLISFRNNYNNCHYSYLYSRHHMFFNELLKIREFFFYYSTMKSPCPIGPTNYADAVEALKENINYLIIALSATKIEVRSLRDAQSVTGPTSSRDVSANHFAKMDREIEKLKNNHRAEIVKHLVLNKEMSLKLKSEIDLKGMLVIEKQSMKEENERLLVLNQNIMKENERLKEEGENLTSTLLSEGSLLRDTVERQQSELSQFTNENNKLFKSLEINIQNKEKLQADLKLNISQLNREKEVQISLRSLLAEEKNANETLKIENENLKKMENQNLRAYENRHLDDQRIIGERAKTIEELLRKAKEAEKQLSEFQSLNTKLKEENSNMQKTLILNQQVEKRLNENLAIERKRINEEKTLNEQMQMRFDQLKKETKIFQKESNESRNKVASMEQDVKVLRETVSQQQTTKKGLENRVQEKDTELDKFRRETSTLKNQVSELNSNFRQKDAELEDSRKMNDTLKKEIGLLRTEVVNLKKNLKEKENEIDDFKGVIIRQNARMEQAISSKNKITKDYEQLQNQKESKMKNSLLHWDEMLKLRQENQQLIKIKESLKEGILELQQISDEKETKAEEEFRMKLREIEEFHKSQSNTQTFYREIKSNLRCTICTNVFEKAVTLNCSHSYCEHCINDWRRAKDECPTCRSVVDRQIEVIVLNQIVDVVKYTTLQAKSITGPVSEAVTTGTPVAVPHTPRTFAQDYVVHSAAIRTHDLAVAAVATPAGTHDTTPPSTAPLKLATKARHRRKTRKS